MSEITPGLIAILAALVGSWLGYRLGRASTLEQEGRATRNLARALLLESRFLEGTLRQLAEMPKPLDHVWYIPSPTMDRLFPEFRLLPNDVAVQAHLLHGLVEDIRTRLTVFASLAQKTRDDHRTIQGKAYFAWEALRDLVAAIEEEWGSSIRLPRFERKEFSLREEVPKLPPPVHPDLWP